MREIVGKLEYSWIMVVEDWETLQQYKKDKIFLRNGQVQKLEKKFNDAAAACESYRQKWRDRGVLNPVADNEMLALEAAFDKASDENDEVTKINQRVKMVEQLPILTGKPLPIKHYELSPGETIIS